MMFIHQGCLAHTLKRSQESLVVHLPWVENGVTDIALEEANITDILTLSVAWYRYLCNKLSAFQP